MSRHHSVLVTGGDGFIRPDTEEGFFVRETRLISHYRYLINDEAFHPVTLSNTHQHDWSDYYIQLPPELTTAESDATPARHSLELLVHRKVASGLQEKLQLTNYNQIATSFCFAFELDADFADQQELSSRRKQRGELRQSWQRNEGCWELRFDYRVRHHYEDQGNVGDACLYRGLVLRFINPSSEPYLVGSRILFHVNLPPHQSWQACIEFLPVFENTSAYQESGTCSFDDAISTLDKL